jgi:hypothetical protein
MSHPHKKLALVKETLTLLTEQVDRVQGGMPIIDTSHTGTYKPTTGPNCIETSVSVCNTNCGCKFTN